MVKKGVVMVREYVYDYAVDGGATGDLEMRAADGLSPLFREGVLVKDAVVLNETALAGGSALTFGTKTDPDGFLADCFAKVDGLHEVVRAGEVDGALLFDTTADAKRAYRSSATVNDQKVVMNIGTAALTGGKLRLMLEVYNPGSGLGDLS